MSWLKCNAMCKNQRNDFDMHGITESHYKRFCNVFFLILLLVSQIQSLRNILNLKNLNFYLLLTYMWISQCY